jgi:hypothetical protein
MAFKARMRRVRHVNVDGVARNLYTVLIGRLNGKYVDKGVDVRVILKFTLEEYFMEM